MRPSMTSALPAIIVAVACAVTFFFMLGCEDKEPCEKPYSCPNREWIDCQPVVLPEFQDMCYGECHEWIVEHCPDVEFYW
jgi:hypothetical protein